jgi:hypothetical protein
MKKKKQPELDKGKQTGDDIIKRFTEMRDSILESESPLETLFGTPEESKARLTEFFSPDKEKQK